MGTPPHPVEPFLGVRKSKNLRLLLSDAESSPGYHITPTYVRVPGADGTTAWGRRVRGRDIFMISCFDLRPRQRYRARERETGVGGSGGGSEKRGRRPHPL